MYELPPDFYFGTASPVPPSMLPPPSRYQAPNVIHIAFACSLGVNSNYSSIFKCHKCTFKKTEGLGEEMLIARWGANLENVI